MQGHGAWRLRIPGDHSVQCSNIVHKCVKTWYTVRPYHRAKTRSHAKRTVGADIIRPFPLIRCYVNRGYIKQRIRCSYRKRSGVPVRNCIEAANPWRTQFAPTVGRGLLPRKTHRRGGYHPPVPSDSVLCKPRIYKTTD